MKKFAKSRHRKLAACVTVLLAAGLLFSTAVPGFATESAEGSVTDTSGAAPVVAPQAESDGEQITTLASISVTVFTESELRTAVSVNSADGIQRIVTVVGTIPLTGSLTSMALSIPNGANVVLSGEPGMGATIKGDTGMGNLLNVYPTGTLTVRDLTITRDAGPTGSGINNFGTLIMEGGTLITGNTANHGGGVYNQIGASFTMNGGEISGNKTPTVTSGTYYNSGGGVYNDGVFIMNGGKITGNQASNYGGGVCSGSGVFNFNGGEISHNKTSGYGGGVANINDSSSGVNGGSVFTMPAGGTGTISDNTAVNSYGGGVYNNTTFVLKAGTISQNNSGYGCGVYNAGAFTMDAGTILGNSGNDGAGVYNNKSFTMNGGAVSGNTAVNSAGGLYNNIGAEFYMNGGELTGNFARTSGGGVFNERGSLYVHGAISGNTSNGGGGGVYNGRRYSTSSGDGSMILFGDGSISGNFSNQGSGSSSGDGGGGVFNNGTCDLRGEVSGNTSGFWAGGVYNGGTLTVSGTVSGNKSVRFGGGVCNTANMTLEATGKITGNTVGKDSYGYDIGGGVCNYSGVFTSNGVISGNSASFNGGGVYNAGTLTANGYITDNEASKDGGGVYNTGDLTSDATISGNSANNNGGGIYSNSAKPVSIDGTISKNGTGQNGGGVWLYNSAPVTIDAAISDNIAGGNGGGVYNDTNYDYSTTIFGTIAFSTNSSITGNTAGVDGGGIYNNNFLILRNGPSIYRPLLVNGLISNNKAAGNGGGVYNYGALTTTGNISGNAAAQNGGGVYNATIDFDATYAMAGTISNNTAGLDGGGIYTDPGNYGNLSLASGAVGGLSALGSGTVAFSGNTAQYAVNPPANDPIRGHAVNPPGATSLSTTFGTAFSNYDINYLGDPVTYSITFQDYDGTVLKQETVMYGASTTPPADPPARKGYTFTGWDKPAGAWTNVMADAVITATYEEIATPPPVTPPPVTPPPVTPPPVTPPPGGGGGGGGGGGTPPPAPTPTAPATTTTIVVTPPPVSPIVQATVPPAAPPQEAAAPPKAPATIAPPETPLAAGHSWSLISLVLAIAALMIAALLLVSMARRSRRFDDELFDLDDRGLLTDEARADIEARRKQGFVPRLLAVIAGIATPAIWLIVDWPLDKMVPVNGWTPFIAVLFVVSLALTVVYNARKDKSENEDRSDVVYSK